MNGKTYILFALVLFASACLLGQPGTRPESGKVLDFVSGQPIAYATVGVSDTAGKPVKTILTTDSGSFHLPLLPAGVYLLKISAVGYTLKTLRLDISDSTLPFNPGIILLAGQRGALATVTVTAQPPLVKQEVDRLAYDVQADPENKIISVLDMLRKVPLVSVDAEDNIELKGSPNFRILINGKTSPLVSGNAKEVLRTMPASTIERIEVITVPPAKYEAEGLAGIINIITYKKIEDGYKGTVTTYYRRPVAGPGFGGSFSIQKGKLGAVFFGGFNRYHAPEQQNSSYRQTTGAAPTVLQVGNTRRPDGSYAYGGSELSYAIDSLHLLTANVSFKHNSQNTTNHQFSDLSDVQQQLLQHYQLNSEVANNSGGIGAGIDYQLGFKHQKARLLTFSYKYTQYSNAQTNRAVVFDAFNYDLPDYRQTNQTNFREHTLQADYVHPLRAKGILEAGMKAILRNNKSDFRYLSKDSASGSFTEIPAFTNSFHNNQSVWAAYASLLYNPANWSIKAGIRAEASFVNADFISTGSGTRQHYINFIPSFSAQRKYRNNTSLTLGFTQRIQRPAINQLNPFVDRSVPNFETTGNPALRPVLSNNIEIGFSRIRKTTIITNLSYTLVNNNIQQAVVYLANGKTTRSFYDNIGQNKTLAGNINITWPVSSKFNLTMGGTLGYMWLRGAVDGITVRNSGIKASINTSVSYTFGKGWRINENLNYYSPFLNLQGSTDSYLNPSLSVSKDFKQFSFSASAVNYFRSYFSYDSKTAGPGFNQLISYEYFSRVLIFSINYRFGKLSKQIEKNKRGINNDDLNAGN